VPTQGPTTALSEPYLNDITVFDVNTRTWHTPDVQGARPPVRDSHAAVALGSRMVIYGGDCGKEYLSDVWAYDVLQQRWQAFKVLFHPQQWIAVLADDIRPLLTCSLCHLSTKGVDVNALAHCSPSVHCSCKGTCLCPSLCQHQPCYALGEPAWLNKRQILNANAYMLCLMSYLVSTAS